MRDNQNNERPLLIIIVIFKQLTLQLNIFQMSMFRSAEMKYFEMYIPKEDAYDVISKVAGYSFVQFLNATELNYHKPYLNSIKRCQEIIQKAVAVLNQAKKQHIEMPPIADVVQIFNNHYDSNDIFIVVITKRKITPLALLDEIEHEIEQRFIAVDKLTKSLAANQDKIQELSDFKYLLFKAREIFAKKQEGDFDFEKTTFELLRLENVSGIVKSKDILNFQKMIFRATKGNNILYTFNIPKTNEQSEARTAFISIVESGNNILGKVNRICDSFNAKKYKIATNKDEVFEKIKQIQDTINDTKQLQVMTLQNIRESLIASTAISDYGCSRFEAYRILLEREVIIFQTMNFLVEQYNTLVAKIWVPAEKEGLLRQAVPNFVNFREAEPEDKPPTHFEVNSFTAPFQEIINTYGVPRYQEVNPALFAIPIFPFLFGVMFGDIGHGGLVLCFSLWLIYSERAKIMLPDIHNIRYLILLMGSFAFYSGWIYNEFFSIPLNVFGSCYGHAKPEHFAHKQQGCVYPFGFDPKWIRSSNELNFFNSYKMKFAVIIGVLQMTFAILLKMLNTLYFKAYLDFLFEWLPQQIFFFCTFGYMSILILYKWTIHWGVDRDTHSAPSIIGQMIALPLQFGSTQGRPLWNQQNQEHLQYYLLMISLICVPWMLIPKPLIIWLQTETHPQTHQEDSNSDNSLRDQLHSKKQILQRTLEHSAKKGVKHEEHDISEIAVHQIIQTIEFVLGSISNTASYLRLWALSLAHGQLSKVFLEKTIGGGIVSANIIIILLGMFFFYYISLGVIMGMDTMECFLHALRLQWVQFNSKFFKADGWKFAPLTLEAPLQQMAINMRVVES